MKKIQPRAIEKNASTSGVQSEKKLSWYARLFDEKKAEYLQRQHIARQQTVMNTHNNGTIIPFRSYYVY
jgi:hypothetical protein